MAVGKELEAEIEALRKKRDDVVRSHAIGLKAKLAIISPVDTGELRRSWNEPTPIPKGWRITNHAPHAVIIDGGRRTIKTKKGNPKTIGSEFLPKGYKPHVKQSNKELNEKLKKL